MTDLRKSPLLVGRRRGVGVGAGLVVASLSGLWAPEAWAGAGAPTATEPAPTDAPGPTDEPGSDDGASGDPAGDEPAPVEGEGDPPGEEAPVAPADEGAAEPAGDEAAPADEAETGEVEPAVPATTEAEAAPAAEVPPPAPDKEPAAASHAEAKERPIHSLHQVKIPKIRKTQMWVTNTTYVDYFGNNYNPQSNDDQFVALVNYLNFGTDSRFDKWTLSSALRVDTQNLFNAKSQAMCDLDGNGEVTELETNACAFGDDYRLERVKLVVGTKHVKLTGGDYNVNWSRGLALSVRKINDTTAIDPTIKGGKVDLETKVVDITALGGVGNRQQSDYATRQLYEDPGYPHGLCEEKAGAFTRNAYGNPVWTSCTDIISGGRVEAKLPGKVRLGTHYAFIWFGEQTGGQFDALHMVGGDLGRRRIAKVWDIHAGTTALLRNHHQRENYPELVEDGLGVYLENIFSIGNATLLVDGKYYDNYVVARDVNPLTVQYSEAPTLEREDQQIPGNANSMGGRVRLDYTFPEVGVTIFANALGYVYALSNEIDMLARSQGRVATHGFIGLRWDDYERHIGIYASGGYRWEGFQQAPAAGVEPYERKLPHAEAGFKKGLGNAGGFVHSIELKGDWRREQRQKGEHIYHFHKGNLILGYNMAPFINLALIGGYSTEFPALRDEPALQNQPCEGAEASCLRKPHLWPGAELRFNFLSSSFVRIFGGRQVGGLLCVNGSCRVLPDFEGVRGDLVLSF